MILHGLHLKGGLYMESKAIKIASDQNQKIIMKLIPGHFATSHSHINYYIDMTTMKSRRAEAVEVARTLARKYENSTIVDTIVCLDGCEVIGAYLADELTKAGIMSMNAHQTIYVIQPEFANGQLIFRDNIQPMLKNKNVLLLVASATTGKTISRSVESINYYGGIVQGISAIFSNISKVAGMEVNSIFTKKDIPNYESYSIDECAYCKGKHKIDAIVNSYGYSKL